MSADEVREPDERMQVPPPAADVCPQRVQLLRVVLNLSSTTDQDKYNDVLESVQNWNDVDMRAFVHMPSVRTEGETHPHRNKGPRGA